MTIERKRIGSGITAREVTVIGFPFGEAEHALIEETWRTSLEDRHLRWLEAWALDVIKKEGIELGDPETPSPPRRHGRVVGIGEGIEHDSAAAYALEIILGIRLTRKAIAEDDAEEAAGNAFTLGEIAREAAMKFKHEADALLGRQVRDGGRRGSKRQRASVGGPTYEQCLARYNAERRAGKAKMAAMESAGASLGVHWKTIQRARGRLEKKK